MGSSGGQDSRWSMGALNLIFSIKNGKLNMSQQEQQNSRLKRERCVLRQDISRGVFNVCKCVCLCSFSSLFFISNCIFGISFKRYKFFFFNIRCRKSSSLQCLPGLYLFFYLNIIVTFGQSQNNFFILLL